MILGHDYANQHWYRDAINRYQRVYRIDPSARGNEYMRRDLVAMIAAPSHGEDAIRVIRRIYGAEIIPDLEAHLAAASDPREQRRIRRLIDSLR